MTSTREHLLDLIVMMGAIDRVNSGSRWEKLRLQLPAAQTGACVVWTKSRSAISFDWSALNHARSSTLTQNGTRTMSTSRQAVIPSGAWPRRMTAEIAAGYCGETTVEAFLKRVGTDYPQARVREGRRRLWLKDDLDRAILPPELAPITDIATDL
jgi:hypothetical protein